MLGVLVVAGRLSERGTLRRAGHAFCLAALSSRVRQSLDDRCPVLNERSHLHRGIDLARLIANWFKRHRIRLRRCLFQAVEKAPSWRHRHTSFVPSSRFTNAATSDSRSASGEPAARLSPPNFGADWLGV